VKYDSFLEKVLDTSQGFYCLVGIKGKNVKQLFTEEVSDVENIVDNFLKSGRDAYFACGTLKDNSSRKQNNVVSMKSCYIDLDCGTDKGAKGYETQQDALVALKKFCGKHNLPLPSIVDSGYGVHGYWAFTKPITVDEWYSAATRLKKLCIRDGLRIDPTVTADAARVLRMPGTKNFKYGTSVDVTLVHTADNIEYETFCELTEVVPLNLPDFAGKSEVSELTKRLMSDRRNSFEKILRRTLNKNGCNQIRFIIQNQEDLHYDLWRAGLSIARNCSDWEKAIHLISYKHKNYSKEETEVKAEDTIDKPYKCEKFKALNPEGCLRCLHKKKISSPIQLGLEIEFAAEGDAITNYTPDTKGGWDTEEESVLEEKATETTVFSVPKLPYNYFRGKNGGIYLLVKGEDGETDDAKLVYENDLFVIKRMYDANKGELVLVSVRLPKDKPKEFVIALADMNSNQELRKILAKNGIICMPFHVDTIMAYLIASTKLQQSAKDAEILRQQMGWADGDKKFIWGTVEIGADEDRYSPPSSTTEEIVNHLTSVGDFDVWKDIVSTFDQPGFEPHSFAFFSAFGAPLMKFSAYKGAFINLIHGESGTGKTTILRLINSVFGHPFELLSKERDTLAHKFFRMGVLNNIAYPCDELTNIDNVTASNLIYGITQGKGAGRMQGAVNEERKNTTSWSTIGIGSSNNSMAQMLMQHRVHASGEMMRLIEYPIEDLGILNKDKAAELFDVRLHANYGWAGKPYIKFILNNRNLVEEKINTVQKFIDEKVGFTNKHRFWSAVLARNIAGASIAKDAGLINNRVVKVLEWVVNYLGPYLLDSVQGITKVNTLNILGEFLNDNINNTLIIDSSKDTQSGLSKLPLVEPKHRLLIRVEPDTNLVFIATNAFRAFCLEKGIIYKDILDDLKKRNVYIRDVKKRLGTGTNHSNTPPVWAIKLHYDINEGRKIV